AEQDTPPHAVRPPPVPSAPPRRATRRASAVSRRPARARPDLEVAQRPAGRSTAEGTARRDRDRDPSPPDRASPARPPYGRARRRGHAAADPAAGFAERGRERPRRGQSHRGGPALHGPPIARRSRAPRGAPRAGAVAAPPWPPTPHGSRS